MAANLLLLPSMFAFLWKEVLPTSARFKKPAIPLIEPVQGEEED